jgi:hypothetical protein
MEDQLVANLAELTPPVPARFEGILQDEELRRKVDHIEKSLNEIALPFSRR